MLLCYTVLFGLALRDTRKKKKKKIQGGGIACLEGIPNDGPQSNLFVLRYLPNSKSQLKIFILLCYEM